MDSIPFEGKKKELSKERDKSTKWREERGGT
jgi:hypothetical protein